MKLLKEVHGDEEEGGVFGGLDGVAREVPVGLTPLALTLVRQVGLQTAQLLLPHPLTCQGVPQQAQGVPPRHGGSFSSSLPQLRILSAAPPCCTGSSPGHRLSE